MLNVLTSAEVLRLIQERFHPLNRKETVPLNEALGRVLCEAVCAKEYVPDFDRSTVDGYAIHSSDAFGCSDAIPAILPLAGKVEMGETPSFAIAIGSCAYVPTGGAIPDGADCVVMLEYTEDYGDGTIGILKPGAPGMNLVYRGDDVSPGDVLYPAGHRLSPQDIGALAALGITSVPVFQWLHVAVISTGDELIPPEQTPERGQIRDVNSLMLTTMLWRFGASTTTLGIVPDTEAALTAAVREALEDDACDAVLISGGSSVGEKDATCRVISSFGDVLFHGIAIKPGKPTILGVCGEKPLVGLPGHPAAAFYIMKLFILPLLARLVGQKWEPYTIPARLSESVSANHGREQISACRLIKKDSEWIAEPIRSKSGLITQLSGADGFFCIARDQEGLPAGAEVNVYLCED